MKKIFSKILFLVTIMVSSLFTSCLNNNIENSSSNYISEINSSQVESQNQTTINSLSSEENNKETSLSSESKDTDVLIAYFSCTNNTKEIAEKIEEITEGEIFRIIPTIEYTSQDLNYNNNDSRANKEQNDSDARPEIKNRIENISKYNVVYLGYPIWWGKLPKIIYTFLDTYDFSNKTIVPFCTSGSSGISTSVGEIRNEEPNAKILDGRRFNNNVSLNTIKTWIDGLDLNNKKKKMRK